mmetsp:Transcript_20640/g.39157  ORF Transcript_20640/g.39157 Transcript_20640/m.39157 type:complete len:273 (-) Transcript_20640:791-1609(-)
MRFSSISGMTEMALTWPAGGLVHKLVVIRSGLSIQAAPQRCRRQVSGMCLMMVQSIQRSLSQRLRTERSDGGGGTTRGRLPTSKRTRARGIRRRRPEMQGPVTRSATGKEQRLTRWTSQVLREATLTRLANQAHRRPQQERGIERPRGRERRKTGERRESATRRNLKQTAAAMMKMQKSVRRIAAVAMRRHGEKKTRSLAKCKMRSRRSARSGSVKRRRARSARRSSVARTLRSSAGKRRSGAAKGRRRSRNIARRQNAKRRTRQSAKQWSG